MWKTSTKIDHKKNNKNIHVLYSGFGQPQFNFLC